MLFKTKSPQAINIFYCYAREDRKLRNALADNLSNLRWQGLITEWHDFDISPGQEWEKEIADHLESADIILLLITRNFMASYYCHEVEMKRAIERHRKNAARVIPIHLRRVDWENAPFSKLQALPTGAKPVNEWRDKDIAYNNICEGIKRVVNEFLGYPDKSRPKQTAPKPSSLPNKQSFAAEGYSIAVSSAKKKLPPMRYEPSPGERIQDILLNFSFQEFKNRSQGYLVLLLFTFGVFDLIVLPYFITTWSQSTLVGISAFLLISVLFVTGTFTKHSAIGGIITFLFFILWTLTGIAFLPGYFHIHGNPYTIFLGSFIVSLLRLELLRKHRR